MFYFLFSGENGYMLNLYGLLGRLFVYDDYIIIDGVQTQSQAISFPIVLSFLLIAAFVGYLIGGINTAVIVSGKMYSEDIRTQGSKNPGFANMMRTYGGKAAAITFAGDFIKAVVAVTIGWVLFGYIGALSGGFFAFIGHIFPLYYKFRGGKGIVCLAGILFMLDWRMFLICLAVFIVAVLVTKYISFGSVLSSMTLPIFMSRMYSGANLDMARIKAIAVFCAIVAAVIVIIKHWGNLKRIFDGTESKFEFKKSKKRADGSSASE